MSEQTGPAHRDLGDRGSGCRAQAGRGLQACAAGVPTCRGPDLVDAKEQRHICAIVCLVKLVRSRRMQTSEQGLVSPLPETKVKRLLSASGKQLRAAPYSHPLKSDVFLN